MTGSRMPGLRGLKSRESKRWDLSLNLEKQFLEKLVQLPLRSQGDQGFPAPGHLQLQILVLCLPEELQNYFVFWPWSICKRRMILRRNLVLRRLRLLLPGRTMSIRNHLKLCIFGSWEICWFLWFYKLREAFSKVTVNMTELAFERDLLIIQFLNVAPFS